MKTKIVGIIVCILVSFTIFSIPVEADSDTTLITAVYGGFPFPGYGPIPNLIHNVSGLVWNFGKVPAYNISCTLIITGGINDNINKTISYNRNELSPKRTMAISLTDTYGFGLVIITITVTSTNADPTTRTAKGIQMGSYTWIPLSWIIPGILQDLFPWLN
jgi:hypothetical protein